MVVVMFIPSSSRKIKAIIHKQQARCFKHFFVSGEMIQFDLRMGFKWIETINKVGDQFKILALLASLIYYFFSSSSAIVEDQKH